MTVDPESSAGQSFASASAASIESAVTIEYPPTGSREPSETEPSGATVFAVVENGFPGSFTLLPSRSNQAVHAAKTFLPSSSEAGGLPPRNSNT